MKTTQPQTIKVNKETKIMLLKYLRSGYINTNELAQKLNLNIMNIEQITGMIIK